MTKGIGRSARSLARIPIMFYNAGYGSLFGHRLLMLEHIGRKSGRPRYVILEVVSRRPRSYVVASGKGEAADWYRNITREPQVHLSVARNHRVPATAQRLDQEEARSILAAYSAERPRTWRALKPLISRLLGRPREPDEELFASVPLVELTLHNGGG